MNKPMKKLVAWTAFLTMAVAGVCFLQSCSDSPLAPTASHNGLNALLDAEAQLGGRPVTQAGVIGSLVSDKDTVLVDKDGGILVLGLGTALSTLNVPSGALTNDVLITAAAVQLSTRFGQVTLYEFGPDGLAFEDGKYATLTLKTTLPEDEVLALYYYDPVTGRWEWQEDATVDGNGEVRFAIWHFSKYGIS